MLTTPTDTGSAASRTASSAPARRARTCVADRDAIAAWAAHDLRLDGPHARTTRPRSWRRSAPTPTSTRRTQENARALVQAGAGAGAVPEPRHHPPARRPRPAAGRGRRRLRPRRGGDRRRHRRQRRQGRRDRLGAHARNFVAHYGLPVQEEGVRAHLHGADATPGREADLPAILRDTGRRDGHPFDYPLSSRLDENDAIFVLDKRVIPWEDVFVYGDIGRRNNFFPAVRLPAARRSTAARGWP